MNTEILNQLKERREIVISRFEKMVQSAEKRGSEIINNQNFFFQVVANHFEEMSNVMVNKCLISSVKFGEQFYKAIEKAEYACAKPAREANKSLYPKY